MPKIKLPIESGIYKYVLFIIDKEYYLHIGEKSKMHFALASGFLNSKNIRHGLTEIILNPKKFGILGGGILEYKNKMIFHGGSSYGNPQKKDIDNLMKSEEIDYETPLDEFEEERATRPRNIGNLLF